MIEPRNKKHPRPSYLEPEVLNRAKENGEARLQAIIDRELLELAAKAHGGLELDEDYGWIDPGKDKPTQSWHPLTDDGDALRLAVKCGILHEIYVCGDDKVIYRDDFTIHFHECGYDRMATVRRAIVRAAAEIGRAMP